MVNDSESAKRWYLQQKPLYEALAEKVEDILWEVFDLEKINVSNMESREKSIESFEEKFKKMNGIEPQEMQDLAGIRIIAYTNSDVEFISQKIKDLFDIDEKRSSDRSKILGKDKVGYRSVHFVAKFPKERFLLPEFTKFQDLYFEIQIRTILQHAWAEIEHDKGYKFSGFLPENLQRRFALMAGMLEVADNEFDNISLAIGDYSSEISQKTREGELNISINSTSLRQYLVEKFGGIPNLKPLFGPKDNMSRRMVQELRKMGINSLKQLDDIIPFDLKEKVSKYTDLFENFCGLIRFILVIYNADDYFNKAWENKWSFSILDSKIDIYSTYGVNIFDLSKKYGVGISE